MITAPIPFAEAIGFLLNKEDLPAEWEASDWSNQEADFRNRAFWSAKVENARFLDRAHGFLFDYMAKTRETIVQPDGTVVTALQISGREQFVKRMTDFMIAEGMAAPGEFVNVDQKDITDIRSVARLRLIFDTNVRQAYGYGQWKQGMKPAVLRAFPAARLVRERGVKEPRPRHQDNLGEVMLKTDPRWAEFHNAKEIGGFGVPWGPYGFQSGVTQEDVSRREAIKLGIKFDNRADEPTPVDMSGARITNGLEASVKGMDPAIKEKLLEELRAKKAALGNPLERAGEAGRRAGENARREMLSRGLADAEARGDASKAGKYRKAIAELPGAGLKVRDDGDKIVLEGSPQGSIIVPISDEINPRPSGEEITSPAIGDLGGKDGSASDVAGRIDRAIKRNPPQGRETLDGKIKRERQALEQIRDQDPEISIAFHEVSDIDGTNEHNIRIAPDGRFWKYTKGDQYGYIPADAYADLHDLSNVSLGIDPASPSEYLERVRLHNAIFGDDLRIEGVSTTGGLVVSQPHVKGREATEMEIDSALTAAGWVKVPSDSQTLSILLKDTAWYHGGTKTIMVDARPANILIDKKGRMHVIDVMLRTARGVLLDLLDRG